MNIIQKVANVLVDKPSAACAKVGHQRGLSNLSLTLAKADAPGVSGGLLPVVRHKTTGSLRAAFH